MATLLMAPVLRWRRFWFRSTAKGCPLCSDSTKILAADLIKQGFYYAAITATRLQLELVAVEYYRRVVSRVEGTNPKRERVSFRYIVGHLEAMGEINGKTRCRLLRLYSRSSRIIHGKQQVDRGLAKVTAIEASQLMATMRGGAV